MDIGGYAVMSNHLHVVLRMRPGDVGGLSADEVVRRWWTAYPVSRLADGSPVLPAEGVIRVQAQDMAWVEIRRARLGNLGRLMKC